MASLDSLPPDQRAVLELVLKRGRTYDEIARMLSIDRAGVRERALSAFDALGPQTRVAPERRALITDYLLGQLPPKVSEDTRQRLAQSASERAWARVLASELETIAVNPLPEIPTDGAREPEPAAVPASEPVAASAAAAAAEPSPAATESGASQPRGLAARPSSRRGGIILLSLGALIVGAAVVGFALLSGGGSKKNATTNASAPASTSSTPTTSSTPSTSTSTSTTAANGAKLVAQINLTAPTSATATKPVGVALVLKQGKNTGIAIRAQNLPANGKHDAYAVWLYKSDKDNHILGFVNPAVGSNGVLQAESALPSNAGHFSQLLITKETQQNPKSPGTVVLQGVLKGLS
ncbi:MAG: sigma factor-like helix-turn-helix DNA-binding protein [Solirubrobacterales bacterium]